MLGTFMVGIAAGTVGALMLSGFRLIAGAAQDDSERLVRYAVFLLVATVMAAVAATTLVVAQPDRGLGAALLASPVASATTVMGFVALITLFAGPFTADYVVGLLRSSVAISLFSILVIAVASLVLQGRRTSAVSATVATVVASAVLAGLASFGVLAGYQALLSAASGTFTNQPEPTVASVVPRALYAQVVARPLLEGRVAAASTLSAMQAEHLSDADAAARIRAEILPVLRQMLDRAESVQLDDPEVRTVHEHAIKGAQLNVMGYEKIVSALEQSDRQLLQEGNALLADGNAEWEQWAAATAKL
jgi:hypothetical protein